MIMRSKSYDNSYNIYAKSLVSQFLGRKLHDQIMIIAHDQGRRLVHDALLSISISILHWVEAVDERWLAVLLAGCGNTSSAARSRSSRISASDTVWQVLVSVARVAAVSAVVAGRVMHTVVSKLVSASSGTSSSNT